MLNQIYLVLFVTIICVGIPVNAARIKNYYINPLQFELPFADAKTCNKVLIEFKSARRLDEEPLFPVMTPEYLDYVLRSFPPAMHGGTTDKNKYEVRTIGTLPGSTLDVVTLKARRLYISHWHKESEGLFYFLRGTGYVVIDGQLVPYQPNRTILVPKGVGHGFKTLTPTVFLSINSPGIIDKETGDVDIHFLKRASGQ